MWFAKKCKHEYELIGMFYKEFLTEYSNCFDAINVYERRRCVKCGTVQDTRISHESFLPELHEGRDERKNAYINYLKSKGLKTEIDLIL